MVIRLAAKTGGALLLALLLFATACGDNAKNASYGAGATSTPAPRSGEATNAVSSAANPGLGAILTDAQGMTLYLFANDKPIKPQSSCTGDCPTTWPLVRASEGSGVGAALDPAKLGEVTRADGLVQRTYNDWPLYRFSGDTAPGLTNGQGVKGIWHVAGVDGEPIVAATPARATASTVDGSYN